MPAALMAKHLGNNGHRLIILPEVSLQLRCMQRIRLKNNKAGGGSRPNPAECLGIRSTKKKDRFGTGLET